jgi:hypothetical protein
MILLIPGNAVSKINKKYLKLNKFLCSLKLAFTENRKNEKRANNLHLDTIFEIPRHMTKGAQSCEGLPDILGMKR